MCLAVDGKEVGLVHFQPPAFELGACDLPLPLQQAEDNDVESLEYMCAVGWIAEDIDPIPACIVEKAKGEVRCMTINE